MKFVIFGFILAVFYVLFWYSVTQREIEEIKNIPEHPPEYSCGSMDC